ncbi:uncharacterized protein [Pocillopora verrucosa]|uniref:uncharacterized protein n=1 Tax=Pocillopora verrucosa TaxID=203993 RepID=UPI0033429E83
MAQLRCLRGQNGHRGKYIENVGHRQQQRHIKEIREKADTAMWFSETYGLTPKSLSLEDNTGQMINVNFKSQEFNQGQPNKPYDNLDEEEKEKIRALLFINL